MTAPQVVCGIGQCSHIFRFCVFGIKIPCSPHPIVSLGWSDDERSNPEVRRPEGQSCQQVEGEKVEDVRRSKIDIGKFKFPIPRVRIRGGAWQCVTAISNVSERRPCKAEFTRWSTTRIPQ